MIADLPATLMFPIQNGAIIVCAFQDMAAMLEIAEGGTPESLSALVVATKADFVNGIPEDEDPIGISIKGGPFKIYEIEKVMGANDDNEVSLTFTLKSADN